MTKASECNQRKRRNSKFVAHKAILGRDIEEIVGSETIENIGGFAVLSTADLKNRARFR